MSALFPYTGPFLFSPITLVPFFFFYGLAISQYMRTSLDAITSPWQAMGAHLMSTPALSLIHI